MNSSRRISSAPWPCVFMVSGRHVMPIAELPVHWEDTIAVVWLKNQVLNISTTISHIFLAVLTWQFVSIATINNTASRNSFQFRHRSMRLWPFSRNNELHIVCAFKRLSLVQLHVFETRAPAFQSTTTCIIFTFPFRDGNTDNSSKYTLHTMQNYHPSFLFHVNLVLVTRHLEILYEFSKQQSFLIRNDSYSI